MTIWEILSGAIIFYAGFYLGRDAYHHIVSREYLNAFTSAIASVLFLATSANVVTQKQFTWITSTTNVLLYIFFGFVVLGFVVDIWRDVMAKRWDSAGAGGIIVLSLALIMVTTSVLVTLVGFVTALIGATWRHKYDAEVPEGRFSKKVYGLWKKPKSIE